jgi:hypothetical protein
MRLGSRSSILSSAAFDIIKYPKLHKYLKQQNREARANTGDPAGEYGTLAHLESVSPSKRRTHAEASAVYHTLTNNGPDISWDRMMPKLRHVRKHGDILKAYESGKLVDNLEKAGLLGRSSDSMRHEGDKYYSALPSDFDA